MTRWIYVGFGTLVLILIGYAVWSWYRGPRVDVVAARATRQTIHAYVDERGMTRAPERYEITMPYDGRIDRIDLQEGDRVTAGQHVVRLVEFDVKLDVAAAEAVVHRLEASLAENADVSLELTAKQQSELIVQAVKAMADAAQFQRVASEAWAKYWSMYAARIARLRESTFEAESEDELERAKANREASTAEVAQRELNAESQMQLHQALKLMPQMILDYVQRKKLQGDVIAKQLQEAKVGLEQAILRSQRATMNSPIDGVVLDRPVFNEQYLRAGTVLLTIARLQDMEVESDVLTQEAAGIHVDDPTEVYGPAIGAPVGQGIRGKVKRVSPDAFTKVSSLGVEEQRANVVIAIDDAAKLVQQRPALGFGFRVRVRIYTSTKEDALTIPRAALLRGGRANQWQLFVIRGGRAVLQDVDVGLMNEQSAEVTKGLDEGQQVVLAPESNLSAGMRVSAQPTSGEPGFDKGVIDE